MLGKENLPIVGQNSSNINHNDYENDRGRYRQMRVLRRSTKKVFKRDEAFCEGNRSLMGRLGHLCNPKQARSDNNNNNNKHKGIKATEKQSNTKQTTPRANVNTNTI